MLQSEPSLASIGEVLLDVARVVDGEDKTTSLRLVEHLEVLASLQHWTWTEASDDLSTAERLKIANRIKLEFFRTLLASVTGSNAELLRASLARTAPELLERFEAARTASAKRLDDVHRFTLFILDDPAADEDPDFDLPYPVVAPGPSAPLKL